MKRFTTGQFARALKPSLPIVTVDMVQDWVESPDTKLKAWKNPVGQGWNFIIPETVIPFLAEDLHWPPNEIREVLQRLGFSNNLLGVSA